MLYWRPSCLVRNQWEPGVSARTGRSRLRLPKYLILRTRLELLKRSALFSPVRSVCGHKCTHFRFFILQFTVNASLIHKPRRYKRTQKPTHEQSRSCFALPVHPGSGQGWVKINSNQLLRARVSQLWYKKWSQCVELMDRVHSFRGQLLAPTTLQPLHPFEVKKNKRVC